MNTLSGFTLWLQRLDFLRPLPSLRLRDVKDVIWCLPEDSQTPTRPGACEDISLGKEHQAFFLRISHLFAEQRKKPI